MYVLSVAGDGPSHRGQPKFAPATPSLISSHKPLPTSLMNIRPVVLWKVNVNGLRSPIAQIVRLIPLVTLKNGLSFGTVPSEFTRRIFPSGVSNDAELVERKLSPTATYNFLSGPKFKPPELCNPASPSAGKSNTTNSLPGTAVSPLAVNRLTRLCGTGVGTV